VPRTRHAHPKEFRREAFALVRSSLRSIPHVAGELGVAAVASQVGAPADADHGRRVSLTSDEREQLRRLRRENRRRVQERESSSEPRPSSRGAETGQVLPVHLGGDGHLARLPDAQAARRLALGLPRPAGRTPSKRWVDDVRLLELIHAIHRESRGDYGAPGIHAGLRARVVRLGRKRVARLMPSPARRARQAAARARSRFGSPACTPASSLVWRDFRPQAANRLWVADVDPHSDLGGLALPVGHDRLLQPPRGSSMRDDLRFELVVDALERRMPRPGLVDHSDSETAGCGEGRAV
jgi:transposase-like protein